MPIFWYRYRDDLWKKVTIYEGKSSDFQVQDVATSEDKLKNNIRRAACMVEAYSLCNDWDYFGTFTLNPRYHDRTDLDAFRTEFMRFIRNCRRSYGDIQCVLVPELHKNKEGWHMHGLFRGIPVSVLRPFTLRERIPQYIRDKLLKHEPVYDWPAYRRSFGWVDIEPIKNRDAAARYITKYITKSQDATASEIGLGKHLYYVTRGLLLPERIESENAPVMQTDALSRLVSGNSYEFDFGHVQWFQLVDPT